MSRWVKYDLDIDSLPDTPAVYCIYHKNSLVYIGQTINLRTRIKGHIKSTLYNKPAHKDDCYLKVSLHNKLGEWLMREYRLITRLNPVWNKTNSAVKPIKAMYKIKSRPWSKYSLRDIKYARGLGRLRSSLYSTF